jgi:glycosyltransferase involved in cell wall biosynthesis
LGTPVRVAIAHDWMVSHSGSERCVEELLVEFPGSRLLTTVMKSARLPPALRFAQPSFLQHVPGAVAHHDWFLPVMPIAWSVRRRIRDADVVVSSSHACAKAVRYEPGIPHVCYCHTPMRYAWGFEAPGGRVPSSLAAPMAWAMTTFRRWDRRTAQRVTHFVANSTAVAERIRNAYGREAQVVFPPVRTDFFTPNGSRAHDRFLFVGRLISYKRPNLIVEAFRDLPYELLIVGSGPLEDSLRRSAPANVTFLGAVDDETLRELYRTSRALVFPGEEDFGIAMAEAQACGTPVIAFRRGGARDIVEDRTTGWLIDEQDVRSLRNAIRTAATVELDPAGISRRAQRFASAEFRAQMRSVVEAAVAET